VQEGRVDEEITTKVSVLWKPVDTFARFYNSSKSDFDYSDYQYQFLNYRWSANSAIHDETTILSFWAQISAVPTYIRLVSDLRPMNSHDINLIFERLWVYSVAQTPSLPGGTQDKNQIAVWS